MADSLQLCPVASKLFDSGQASLGRRGTPERTVGLVVLLERVGLAHPDVRHVVSDDTGKLRTSPAVAPVAGSADEGSDVGMVTRDLSERFV